MVIKGPLEALEAQYNGEGKTTMTLKDVLPREFFDEHMEVRRGNSFVPSPVIRLLNVEVVASYGSQGNFVPWPGIQRNVTAWWKLSDGHAVGWNENPCRGWSFPVITL